MTIALGLISGTSVDALDTAIVNISGTGYDLTLETLATHTFEYPEPLRDRLLALGEGEKVSPLEFGALHQQIGQFFGDAANELIHASGYKPTLIGSHGQTVAHQPPTTTAQGFSLQLGDGAVITARTGICTINNFRAADMAYGGQGAPLVPWLDWICGHSATESRCLQNIGGIGNVTYLPSQSTPDQLQAFDTGPGNMILDNLVQHFSGDRYDAGGARARQGKVCTPLLIELLKDEYLAQLPPKSTGRERYGMSYLHHWLQQFPQCSEQDLLATFTEFTAQSIAYSYRQFLPRLPDCCYVSGGGVHNLFLLERLQALLPKVRIGSTREIGIDPDYKEAIAFALLAYLRWCRLPGNLPSVTQAQQFVLLGDLHLAGLSSVQ